MADIVLPRDWKPRAYQLPAWSALESGIKRLDLVWHRRAGKDLFSINWCATQCFKRPGIYWHILPTYRQGRKIVWEGMTGAGRPFLDHFPEELITRKRDDEMSIWLDGGSLYQVIGADEPDRLVGANPFGVIFSEWSLISLQCWNLIRPILVENGGWAIFIYTPRGRNHAYKQRKRVLGDPLWFSQLLSIDDTKVVSKDEIDQLRKEGMAEELIQQEFYCSFDAALVGSFYGDQMADLAKDGRLTRVPWEPNVPVNTAWDLGMADQTFIWFHQKVGKENRIIDTHYGSGQSMEQYIKVLREKPYVYNQHLVPHDAQVRELTTGQSRVEAARDLGIHLTVVPKLSIADGIAAVRRLLPTIWMDEEKTEYGAQALREYTKEQEGIDLDGRPVFREKPKHDWTSHPSDAFRTLAVGINMTTQMSEGPIEYPDQGYA